MVFNIGDQILWNSSTTVRVVKQYDPASCDYLIGVPGTPDYDQWVTPLDIKPFPTKFTFKEQVKVRTREGIGTIGGIQAFPNFNGDMIIHYQILFSENEYLYVYSENEVTKYVPLQYISWNKLGIETDPKILGYKFRS